jgi:sulfur carrier protein
MNVVLNGEPRELTAGTTLADLLRSIDLGQRRFAVEINEELVPRSAHADRVLQAGDRVEIVQAIGGG